MTELKIVFDTTIKKNRTDKSGPNNQSVRCENCWKNDILFLAGGLHWKD